MFPVSCDLLPCDVLLWCCHTIFMLLCDVMYCVVVMWCVLLYLSVVYVMLVCCVMLCCPMLSCADLWCVVLCCLALWCEALWWVVQCFYYPVMWCIVLYCPVFYCDVVCGFSSSFIPNLMLLTTIHSLHKHISFTCYMSSWNLLIQYIFSRFQVKKIYTVYILLYICCAIANTLCYK